MFANRASIYYYTSLVFAVWFAITGILWTYAAPLFISYPIGLLALLFWDLGRKKDDDKYRYERVKRILKNGLIVSAVSFVGFWIFA